jgi:hypothetical protein
MPTPSPDPADGRAVDAEVLRVALGPSEQTATRWAALRARHSPDALDDGRVYPLLPLVGEALTTAGVADPDLGRMRGLRRHTFVTQQLLLADLIGALDVLEEVGARALLLGGVPLALLHYPDPSLRPTAEADVLVSVDAVDAVVGALERAGWVRSGGGGGGARPARDLTRRLSSLRFVAPDERCTLVLHWRLVPWLAGAHGEAGDPQLWDAARPCPIDGRAALAASPDDLLLRVVTRAYRLGWATEPRWVADVAMVVRGGVGSGDDFDWDRLLARVQRGGLVAPVRDALAWVTELVDVAVPTNVTATLAAARDSRGAARRYAAGCRAMVGEHRLIPGRDLVVEWHRQTFNLDAGARARRVVPYVLGRTGADHLWSVPSTVARRRWRGHA